MRPAERALEVVPNYEEQFHLTDLGNAERFVDQHGNDVLYCYPWRRWLVWSRSRWEADDSGKVHRLAKETVRSIYQEAAETENDSRRKELVKHGSTSEAAARIRAMLELAESELPVLPDQLDSDAWVLNCQNGVVDLVGSGSLMPHRRDDLMTKIAPVEYDPDAKAPTWEAFLERVLPSEELRAFVQRAVGYSLTGATSEQCMFINHGVGANGKSTFQEAIAGALGDYAMRAPTEMLLARRSGSVPNDIARLRGARFVTASETGEGRRLAESLIKDLTGQDTITARFMRAEWFDFTPTHKLWLSTNHKPEIRGTDPAIWRRIRLIPWSVAIPPAEQDKRLPDKLRKERAGILAWAVRGCLQWQKMGLGEPDEVRRATGEYRAEMDPLRDFFAERCVVADDAQVMASELLAAYDLWRVPNNEPEITMTKFGRMLVERGFQKARAKNGPNRGKVLYIGIGLRTDDTPPDGGSDSSRREEFAENPSHEKSPANAGKFSGSTESVKSSEGKTQLTAENSLAGDYVEKPFTTLHKGQTLHTSEGHATEVEDPEADDYDRLVEERTASLKACIHEVVGGCRLCNPDRGGA